MAFTPVQGLVLVSVASRQSGRVGPAVLHDRRHPLPGDRGRSDVRVCVCVNLYVCGGFTGVFFLKHEHSQGKCSQSTATTSSHSKVSPWKHTPPQRPPHFLQFLGGAAHIPAGKSPDKVLSRGMVFSSTCISVNFDSLVFRTVSFKEGRGSDAKQEQSRAEKLGNRHFATPRPTMCSIIFFNRLRVNTHTHTHTHTLCWTPVSVKADHLKDHFQRLFAVRVVVLL